jgi:hypothetical protein
VVCTPTNANKRQNKIRIREGPLLPEETTDAREVKVTPIEVEREKILNKKEKKKAQDKSHTPA